MKKTLLFLIIVALNVAHAQERLFLDCDSHSSLTCDINGYIYITKGSAITKYSSTGEKMLTYDNPTLGIIENTDASIGTKILLLNTESGYITLLNSSLSVIGNPLSLFEKNWMDISLAAMGSSDRIVIFDNIKKELTITDLNLEVITSARINFPVEFNPSDMQIVPNQRIMLTDTLNGVCFFDIYGTFERYIPLQDIRAVQLHKDAFYYVQGSKIYRYSIPSMNNPLKIEELNAGIDATEVTDFLISGNKIYYITTNGALFQKKLLY